MPGCGPCRRSLQRLPRSPCRRCRSAPREQRETRGTRSMRILPGDTHENHKTRRAIGAPGRAPDHDDRRATRRIGAVQEIPITTQSAEARLAFEAGQAALDRGDGQQANDLFRTAVAADPNFTYAWFNLSNVSFSTEEFNAALRGGEQGAARASEGERMLLEFNKLFLDNNFSAQLELAQQLTQKYPNSPRAWMLLAAAQAALNKFAEQRATLEKVIALAPELLARRLSPLRGPICSTIRRISRRPRSTTGRPSAIAPGVDMYYWSLGDVYRGSNRLEDARRYYKLALQLDPKDLTAPIKLGHVNSFLGNFDEARADYDRGLKAAGPANAGFLAPFNALTYVYAGEPAKAVQSLEKSRQPDRRVWSRRRPAPQRQGERAHQRRADRHVQRAVRRRRARARQPLRAAAREREGGGHGEVLQHPGSADRVLRRAARGLARRLQEGRGAGEEECRAGREREQCRARRSRITR